MLKKLIISIMIIALFLPAAALAEDYTPALGMTMVDFVMKYNSVQAAIESPYISLSGASWSLLGEYHIASFKADKNGDIIVMLITKDPSDMKSLSSGLDAIQIVSTNMADMMPMICATNRCAKLFTYDLFGASLSSIAVMNVLEYYYENKCKERGLIAYNKLDEDKNIVLSFSRNDMEYFCISSMEELQ